MKTAPDYLSISEIAKRSGVAASALRFYENRGLIQSKRSTGNHRLYHRSSLRRIALIRVAQTLGLSLKEISQAFETLPHNQTANLQDWQQLSQNWQGQLDERINALQRLRDQLESCIGCGCLSLKRCALYNPGDQAAQNGSGPRYLLEPTNGN